MRKSVIISILIAFACFQTVASEGNLLRCIDGVGKTAKLGLELAQKLKAGDLDVNSIKEFITKINPLVQDCTNPICLADAKKRCEEGSGKECEQWGVIMYPKCPEGFQPFGCCLCVAKTTCPNGFRDDAMFCAKPAPYGRGVGYPWKFGDGLNLDGAMKRCSAANQELGCEKNGAIIYPKCRSSYHNVGCCICSPDCPAETKDIGVSCAKKTNSRGLGYFMKSTDCQNSSNEEQVDVTSMLTDDQLIQTIVDMINELKSNESNMEKAMGIISKIISFLSSYEQRKNKN